MKPGTVGLGSQYAVYSPPFTFLSAGGLSRHLLYLDVNFEEYVLKQEELERLFNIYNKISTLDINKFQWLHLAIIRFDFSYNSALFYSPIDLMIGLESLYIADAKELGYKLAMRAAYLLGKTPSQINTIFSTIVAAYGFRSKLVHGNQIKTKIKIMPGVFISDLELTHSVRNILRESILVFFDLSKSYSHKALTASLLDQNILTKGKALSAFKPKDLKII